MVEVPGLQQKEFPYYKRWFRHPEAQLFVWELNQKIVRFMFSFYYENSEYVFSWDADKIQNRQRFLLCLSDKSAISYISDSTYVTVQSVLNEITLQPSVKASQILGNEKMIPISVLKDNFLSYSEKLPSNMKHYIFCTFWYFSC